VKVFVMMIGEYNMEYYFTWQSVRKDSGFVTTQV
jgi:hypothetical protein